MNIEMIFEHIQPFVVKRRQDAMQSLMTATKNDDFDNIMVSLMDTCHWLRVELELLLRTAYWRELSEDEIKDRFVFDQINLLDVVTQRLRTGTGFVNELRQKAQSMKRKPKKPENNDDIIKSVKWQQSDLEKLYNSFHKLLSKFSHPDPFWVFFPSDFRGQVKDNIINMLSKCSSEIDKKWQALRTAGVRIATVPKVI